MRLFWKVFLIVWILGLLVLPIFGGVQSFVYGLVFYNIIYLLLTIPLSGILAVFWIPYVAIPYYAVALGLLYWWEKKKSKTSEVKASVV